MPRVRIRTSDGERIVGTPNCSTLTIRLDAYAQRASLQLRADAQLVGGNAVIEHWSWEFPELPDRTTIELISDPATGLAVVYDPPDVSLSPKVPVLPVSKGPSLSEIQAVEKELRDIEAQLKAIGGANVIPQSRRTIHRNADTPTLFCSFCGKGQDEVRKLVAGPSVFICDECVHIANEIVAD
jgi:hypothetical protein